MKTFLYLIVAFLITAIAIIYQKKTGPTYDKKVETHIENTAYNFNLIRSHGGESDCKIELNIPDQNISGILEYRKYPTNDPWTKVEMKRQYDNLVGYLPHLPPAGKYEYLVILEKNGKKYALNDAQTVVIRFKGDVPLSVLFPHIFFMFFAMFLGNLAGIMALFRHKRYKLFTTITVIALFIGGMVLGPWVQWYAFGEAWAGIPFAWDLTDNKTLFAFIFWVIAFFMNRKKERPVYTVIASLVMLLVYSIPHSMFGSQLDPETGEIIQGWIRLFLI
ncbi:hypothetical protein GM418_18635 [Maribellus comscasis]|uniref:Uncharacterized protein n=1 Tax=Maribellus comscasis TaxID=2681766 RepID=A0A6I6K6H8_9BACT|nr:hypothetical protein [Maribellus comscasis]QGY45614.1 hypothetical protein GM418_18635 [Maribellus comscasis]